ncbi:galactose-specific lectin nattectin-like [Dicentrarchus labrax]|uniref:C-type lectin domain-containing protein n=1 Tax=Dicentrarchus labrax TaxID=13489 RepID=A0A8C4IK75_DICLA|nr:galactose-specific lectin nattectin-like [Dicentrarchus labrax]
MASALHFIVLLCGLWIGADVLQPVEAKCKKQTAECCETATCPPGWTQFNLRCYLFNKDEKDWADAERLCNSFDGNLASLRTQSEYTFIRDLIYKVTNSHKTTWVGASDKVKEGVWLWSDGSNFVFNGWANGEPNNYNGGEGCMEINLGGKDFVNDGKCTRKNSFVCAKDL